MLYLKRFVARPTMKREEPFFLAPIFFLVSLTSYKCGGGGGAKQPSFVKLGYHKLFCDDDKLTFTLHHSA